MSNIPNATPSQENPSSLDIAASEILSFFLEQKETNEILLLENFAVLENYSVNEIKDALEPYSGQMKEYILQKEVQITGVVAVGFVNKFIAKLDQNQVPNFFKEAQYAMEHFPLKSLNIAMVLIFNSQSLTVEHNQELVELGINILKKYSMIHPYSLATYVKERTPQSLRPYESLFEADVRNFADLNYGIRVQKIGRYTSSEWILKKYGIEFSHYNTPFVYLAYWHLKPFSVGDLVRNIDNIPTNVLVAHQRQKMMAVNRVYPSVSDLGTNTLGIYSLKFNSDVFIDLEPDPRKTGAENFQTYDRREADFAVNVALALKIVKESVLSGEDVPKLLEVLIKEEASLDIQALSMAFNDLLYLLDDSEDMDVALEGINKHDVYEKLKDLAVYSSLALNFEEEPSEDGLSVFSPFPVGKHILDPDSPLVPPIDFIPFIVQSYIDIFRAYPFVLVEIENEEKNKEESKIVGKTKRKTKSPEPYYNIGKIMSHTYSFNMKVNEIFAINLKRLVGEAPNINMPLDLIEYDDQIAFLRENISNLLSRLELLDPEMFIEAVRIQDQVLSQMEFLKTVLSPFFGKPQLLNRKAAGRPSTIEPVPISEIMNAHLANFARSRKIRMAHNIRRGQEDNI